MTDAHDYEERVKTIIIGMTKEIETYKHWNTTSEVKFFRKRILQVKKELQEIKKEIYQTKRTISKRYTEERKKHVKGFGYGMAAGIFGWRAARFAYAEHRKKLRNNQDRELSPYNDVEKMIINFHLHLNELKQKIDNWIETFQS